MSWLPEIEDLVAVLDRAEEGRNQMTSQKDIKCGDGTELEWGLFSPS